MNPTTTSTVSGTLDAPETLGALQNALSGASPSGEPAGAHPSPRLRESFLNLREIPQLSFEDARGAFPMLTPGYPEDWKEQVRQLRNRLTSAQAELQDDDATLQVIAFTNMHGGRPRYGTAANLAMAMASIQDTRVLVIDANLSAPGLHSALRLPAGPGLCEATRSERQALPRCFRRVMGTQVYVLPVGDVRADPMDPIDLRGLHSVLRSLRSQFDWIFVDAPGFDTPADTMAVTIAADGVIMMIESERNSFRDVARALGQIQGRHLLGAILF